MAAAIDHYALKDKKADPLRSADFYPVALAGFDPNVSFGSTVCRM